MSTSALSIDLRDYDKEIKEFLGAVLIGSPGGIQYRVHRQKNTNHRDENVHYLCLSKNLKLIGVVGLLERIDITCKKWLYILKDPNIITGITKIPSLDGIHLPVMFNITLAVVMEVVTSAGPYFKSYFLSI